MKKNYKRLKWVVLIILAGLIFLLAKSASAATLITNHRKAPQQQITGTVNGVDNLPLPGVTVSIKGQTRGAITDFEGNYSITASIGDVLVFSFLGYKKQEIPVDDRIEIDIQLKEDINSLEAVEINAGYYNTTRRESTGNISRITAKTIEQQPVLNPLAAMQGRMPGVQITQTTGVPGSGFDIKIRGTNSLRAEGNAPLYIIDGVPYSSSRLTDTNLTGQITRQGESPIDLINPNDIQSIEVLKDADATSIYGSRGANGVVLITTKKGKPGKIKVNVNASTGIAQTANRIDLLNTQQYLEARREAYANDGISEYPSYAYDINGTWDQDRYTDWQKDLIGGTAETYNIRANVSGGTELTNFLISGGYLKQTTVFPGDYHYGKGSVHFNFGNRSENDKFMVNLSGTYSTDKNNQPAVDFTREALMLAPNAPAVYNEDGSLNWANSTWNNPFRNLESIYDSSSEGFVSNMVLDYELLEGLHIKSSFGYTRLDYDELSTTPSTTYDPAYGLTSASSYAFSNKAGNHSWIIEPQLTYDLIFNNQEFKFLGGATFQEDSSEKFVQIGYGFPSNDLITNIAAASDFSIINNDKSKYRYQAFFGRLNYTYDNRYIINLTGRRDGSSRFGPGKRFSDFGAIGLAWLFGNEKFLKDSFISFGKLRGSYGITGNDKIGDYQYLDSYTISSNTYNGISGLFPSRLYNPDFSWESNRKLELGMELAILKNRISVTSSFYRNRSSNQLVGIPLASTTGFSSIQANLDATVENRGWEFEFYSQNFQSKEFSWNTSFNISIPENKLLKFPGLEGSTYASQYIVGEPLDIRKAYQYEGIDSQSGVYTFTDFNGDGVISATDDRQSIIRFNTKYFGGITNHFDYNSFSLDFLFQFSKQKGNNAIYSMGYPIAISNQPVEILDRWQQPGNMASFQKYTSGGNAEAVASFSRFKRSNAASTDASYIRLKNISLSYGLKAKWLGGLTGSIFLQGQNLWTITKYFGLDPETQSLSGLPPLKIISGGIDVSF